MPSETRELMTAEELERFDLPGKSTELVRGRIIVREPPGFHHGHVAARLLFLLGEHVYGRHLGWLSAQDTGFRIESDPDTVRAPDVAFTSRERDLVIPKRGYASFAPDLAVEVLSPDDRPGEILSKVGDWLGRKRQDRVGHRSGAAGGAGLPGRRKPEHGRSGRCPEWRDGASGVHVRARGSVRVILRTGAYVWWSPTALNATW